MLSLTAEISGLSTAVMRCHGVWPSPACARYSKESVTSLIECWNALDSPVFADMVISFAAPVVGRIDNFGALFGTEPLTVALRVNDSPFGTQVSAGETFNSVSEPVFPGS